MHLIYYRHAYRKDRKPDKQMEELILILCLSKVQDIDDAPISIGLKTDTDSMAENVSKFASSYNNFVKKAKSFLERLGKEHYKYEF